MKLVVVQPVLPSYDQDFFAALQEMFPSIDIIVLADIKTQQQLNQYEAGRSQFQVQHLSTIEFWGLILRPGLFRRILSHNDSAVVLNGNPRDVSQLLLLLTLSIIRRPFYVWGMFHRIGGPRLVSTLYYKLVGKTAQKCLCYTRVGAANLVSLGVSPSRIGIIGTAIDERIPIAVKESKSLEELKRFRTNKGLANKHLILQVVRLSTYKKPELLVKAARILLSTRTDLLFAMIGGGEMLNELKLMVQENGLEDYILFLGPIYDENTLAEWYLSASAFVVPTCIGLSAHHAMAYGVPVITDDSLNQQASEFAVVQHGLNGLLYKEGDAHSLAGAIETIVDNQVLRNRLSANAVVTVTEIHSLSKKVNQFAKEVELNAVWQGCALGNTKKRSADG